MAISFKIIKSFPKEPNLRNLTDKIDIQKILPTQSHRVSRGPGVFDASLPADVCVTSLSVVLEK